MPVIALTDLSVNALKPTGKQVKYFDAKFPAFGVREGKNRKTFVVMTGRDRKLVSTGHYPGMLLSEARKQARKLLAGVPIATDDGLSFQDALDAFLEKQAERLAAYLAAANHPHATPSFQMAKTVDRHNP